jgi:NADH-quinone oxidoreductase subunit E
MPLHDNCECTETPPLDGETIDRIIEKYGGAPDNLIQVLLEVQSRYHWLPKAALERIAAGLGVPMARIQHIATFYKAFSVVPRGRHEVHVCMGTACHVRGAARILDSVEDLTGIHPGETDLELKYSLETVNCLGCCALGPVVEIDGKAHGKVTTAETPKILDKYK